MVGRVVGVVFAQIGLDHLAVFLNFFRGAFGDFHPVIQHRDPLAQRHHNPHGVFNQ